MRIAIFFLLALIHGCALAQHDHVVCDLPIWNDLCVGDVLSKSVMADDYIQIKEDEFPFYREDSKRFRLKRKDASKTYSMKIFIDVDDSYIIQKVIVAHAGCTVTGEGCGTGYRDRVLVLLDSFPSLKVLDRTKTYSLKLDGIKVSNSRAMYMMEITGM